MLVADLSRQKVGHGPLFAVIQPGVPNPAQEGRKIFQLIGADNNSLGRDGVAAIRVTGHTVVFKQPLPGLKGRRRGRSPAAKHQASAKVPQAPHGQEGNDINCQEGLGFFPAGNDQDEPDGQEHEEKTGQADLDHDGHQPGTLVVVLPVHEAQQHRGDDKQPGEPETVPGRLAQGQAAAVARR